MTNEKLKNLIEEYLNKAKLMQIATCKNNQPWVCSVYFAFDESLNLYWLSKPTRRHSQEIKENEKIAGTIVTPHSPGEDVRGIQFEGTAQELLGKDAREGMQYYAKRFGMAQERIEKILNNTDGHICYKITPLLFVLFDEKNFPDNPRQEYRL